MHHTLKRHFSTDLEHYPLKGSIDVRVINSSEKSTRKNFHGQVAPRDKPSVFLRTQKLSSIQLELSSQPRGFRKFQYLISNRKKRLNFPSSAHISPRGAPPRNLSSQFYRTTRSGVVVYGVRSRPNNNELLLIFEIERVSVFQQVLKKRPQGA